MTKRTDANKKKKKASQKREKAEAARKQRQAQAAAAKKARDEAKKQEEDEDEYSDEEEDDDDETVSAEELLARASGKPTKSTGKRKKEDQDSSDEEQESGADLMKKIQKLQFENRRLQIRNKSGRGNGARARSSPKTAMEKEVIRVAKGPLWQKCKHIRNENFLYKATKLVMEHLDLPEFDGLEGDALRKAQDLWIERYQDSVREAINSRRSYCLGEVHDYMVEQMADGKMGELPDEQSIFQIAMRDGLTGDDTPRKKQLQKLAVVYWDVLLPKICGVDYWSPTKRNYGLVSTSAPKPTQEDPNPAPYVDPSSEACLVWAFENAYQRWFHQASFRQRNKGKALTDEDCDDPLARKKDGTYVHQEANTRYTTSTSGQARWGGLTQEGRERLKELTTMITQNRKERAEEIKGIESHLLELVREKNGRAEIDARRAQRRRSVAPVAAAEVVEADDAPEDYSQW